MSKDSRCPSCGHMNETQATECVQCNFPLHPELGAVTPPPAAPAEPVAPAEPAAPAASAGPAPRAFDPSIRRVRPIRPRPPKAPQQQLQVQLWSVLGGMAIMLVLFTAYQGFKQNNTKPAVVEGAQQDQQHVADMARAELAKDSTNVNARIALANLLYDTGNWSEAIVHYKSALRTDPQRIETIVDLGVCYYNLSASDEAYALFQSALKLDPNHAITLFNLGIVTEGQNKLAEAQSYYERAQAANPPEGMREQLVQAVQRVKARRQGPAGAGK
jgi:cytochrome c-type biogenesis protein CcmH/NrfG